MLELWGIWSIHLLLSLPGSLWSGVVAPDRVLSISQIELNCVLMLNWIVWIGTVSTFNSVYWPVGWVSKIHRLPLCWRIRPHSNECPGYDTKQFDCEVPVMLLLWWMQTSPLLPLLLGQLWHRVVAPDRALFMGQIELNYVLMVNWIIWNRTVFIFSCV